MWCLIASIPDLALFLTLKTIFGLFESDRFTQVLLYILISNASLDV